MQSRLAALAPVLVLALLLAACGRDTSTPAPPRARTAAPPPARLSVVRLPVSATLAELQTILDREVPRTLWSIDRQEKSCVPAQRATLCLKKHDKCVFGLDHTKVTPDIGCHIIGDVTRGALRLGGSGETLTLAMPVSALVSARDIGGVLKGETATAAAEVRARIRLGIAGDWQPTARVEIDYDWAEEPGIDFLGQRIRFAGKADPKLAEVVARLERELPRQLARLKPRAEIEAAWAKAFSAIEVNHQAPPAWIRVTPQRLGLGGYRVDGGRLTLDLAAEARTETFIGPRPDDPGVTRLPPPAAIPAITGFRFHLPVTADYHELELVLGKALSKLSQKGIALPDIGTVHPAFGGPTMYGIAGGRLAVGLPIDAKSPSGLIAAKGTVWLTGKPSNQPNSEVVEFRDVAVTESGNASPSLRLLVAIARAPPLQAEIAAALGQDFSRDFGKLRAKIDRALAGKRLGDFVLDMKIAGVAHGTVFPYGEGLYLPVEVAGDAALVYAPAR